MVALTVLGVLLTILAVPATRSIEEPSVRRELRTMGRPQLWLVYGVTLLTTAAYMITYSYLAAFLSDVTGVDEVWVPAVLTVFGVGAFAGLTVGGRIADRRPFHALVAGAIGVGACSILLALLAGRAWAVLVLVLVLGIAGFVVNPAIYVRVFAIASQAPTLAGATAVSAFQLGISLVPVLAGVALSSGAGVGTIPLIGAALAVVALPVIALDRWLRARVDEPARGRPDDALRAAGARPR